MEHMLRERCWDRLWVDLRLGECLGMIGGVIDHCSSQHHSLFEQQLSVF